MKDSFSIGNSVVTHGETNLEAPTQKPLTSTSSGNTRPIQYPTGYPQKSDRTLMVTHRLSEERQQQPRFSVVMTHTGFIASTFRPAIRSLIQQSFCDWELIFVSSCSQACLDVEELSKEHGLNVRVKHDYLSETRSERFRRAVGMAHGITVCVLDSDDLLHIHALRTVDWCLRKLPEFKYFTTSHQEINLAGVEGAINTASAYAHTLEAMTEGFRQKHFWGFPNTPKDWIPEMLKSPYICEDYFMFSHMARRSIAILPIPNICYYYRIHAMQLTQQQPKEIARMVASLRAANKAASQAKGSGFRVQQLVQASIICGKVQKLYLPD